MVLLFSKPYTYPIKTIKKFILKNTWNIMNDECIIAKIIKVTF